MGPLDAACLVDCRGGVHGRQLHHTSSAQFLQDIRGVLLGHVANSNSFLVHQRLKQEDHSVLISNANPLFMDDYSATLCSCYPYSLHLC